MNSRQPGGISMRLDIQRRSQWSLRVDGKNNDDAIRFYAPTQWPRKHQWDILLISSRAVDCVLTERSKQVDTTLPAALPPPAPLRQTTCFSSTRRYGPIPGQWSAWIWPDTRNSGKSTFVVAYSARGTTSSITTLCELIGPDPYSVFKSDPTEYQAITRLG